MGRKKWKVLALLVVVMMLFTACGAGASYTSTANSGNGATSSAASVASSAPASAAASGEKMDANGAKVALLTLGAINDGGWNATVYEGLQAMEEYGFATTLAEKINFAEMEQVIRTYADNDYQIIVGHAHNFMDIFTRIAPEYPDTLFVCTNSQTSQDPNVSSVTADDLVQGFLAGCAAGLLTESNKVAYVYGQESPANNLSAQGFELGVKHVNEDGQPEIVITGSNADPVRMKEATTTFIKEGGDVVFTSGNAVGLGTIEACKEAGVMVVGSTTDQNPVAPEVVAISVLKDYTAVMKHVAELYLAGELKGFINMGINEGAVYYSPWHEFEDTVPEEVKSQLEQIQKDVASGTIDVAALAA